MLCCYVVKLRARLTSFLRHFQTEKVDILEFTNKNVIIAVHDEQKDC